MSFAFQYAGKMVFWFGITFLILYLPKRKGISEKRELYKILLLAYITAICSLTLFPVIDFGIDSETCRPYIDFIFRSKEMRGLNLVPFRTIVSQLIANNPLLGAEERLAVGALNLACNLLLYIPVGFLLPLITKEHKALATILAVVLLLSGTIEILQYFVGRSADVDDVMLHMVGATVGYWIWEYKAKQLCD